MKKTRTVLCILLTLVFFWGLLPALPQNEVQADSDFEWVWPIKNGKLNISSLYGKRKLKDKYDFHWAMDIGKADGRAVIAAHSGTIVDHSNVDKGPRGKYVLIRHDNPKGDNVTYYTRYQHLNSINETVLNSIEKYGKGATIGRGDDIGIMGNTGEVTGVHLHFEMMTNKVENRINPLPKYFNGVSIAYEKLRPGQTAALTLAKQWSDKDRLQRYTTTLCTHNWGDFGACKNAGCSAVFEWDETEELVSATIYRSNPEHGKFKQAYACETQPYKVDKTIPVPYPFKIVAKYKNGWNNTWYKTSTGLFLHEKYVDLATAIYADANVKVSVDLPPSGFTQGTAQRARGTITSTPYKLDRIVVQINKYEGQDIVSTPVYFERTGINSTSYSMTVDDDRAVTYDKLDPGYYCYSVEAWDVESGNSKIKGEHYAFAEERFWVNPKAVSNYTISFHSNGGSGSAPSQTIRAGSSVTLPPALTRHNHTFLGWDTNADASSPRYAAGQIITPSGSMTLYAIWQEILPPDAPTMTSTTVHIGEGRTATVSWNASARADTYTATAYDTAGNAISTNRVSGTMTSLLFPSAGTYTVRVRAENAVGQSEDSAAAVTVTVMAPATVTFADHGDKVWATQTVAYGDSAVAPTAPTREGYRFINWEGDLNNVTADRTITAVYQPIPYTVRFYDCEGNVAKTVTVTYDGDTPGAAVPPEPDVLRVPDGYVFAGWDTSAYLSVTESGIDVHPAVIWGNPNVPIEIEVTGVRTAGTGCWVDYTITNKGSEPQPGRTVIVCRTNFGKFLTKTESGAFYLDPNGTYVGNLYVPLTKVLDGDEVFTTVEAYVVDSYTSLSPIAEPNIYYVRTAEDDWSRWMTEDELAAYAGDKTTVQTKTQYSTRTRQTVDSMAPTYLDWSLESTSTATSDWSNWSSWQDAAVTATEFCEVKTQQALATAAYTQYRYGRYLSTDCSKGTWPHCNEKTAKNLYGGTWTPDYSSWSTTRYSGTFPYASTTTNNSLGNGVYGKNQYGNMRYMWGLYMVGGQKYYWEDSRTVPATYKTQYAYRTRTDVTTYHFYKWTEWTPWSDGTVTATDNMEVSMRTLTRVKQTEPSTEGKYSLSVDLGMPEATGKQAILTVYRVDGASDYTNEYMQQVTLRENGTYDFSFYTLDELSAATGDFTAVLTIEGSDTPLYVGTIEAPKPTYQVTFVDRDGSQIGQTQTVPLGGSAVAPEIPSHEGYTFIGWEYGLSNIRDNMTISARYVPNKHTVVFIDWANYTVSMQTDVPHGSQLMLPEVTAPEGYNFAGWAAPEGCDLDNVNASMVVSAEYEQMRYTVRFLDAEGNVLSEQTVGHGEAAAEPLDGEMPGAPTGMFAAGWNTQDYLCVRQPMDIVPLLYFEDDAAWPELSLEPGIYEGAQTLEIICADTDAVLTYNIATAQDESEGEQDYTGPLTISESATISVTASAPNKNSVTETLEYIIAPAGSTPAAPAAATLEIGEESITIRWDAVAGAAGYIIDKADIFGVQERFMTTETQYVDENVYGINDYTYTVGSYALVGEAGREVFLGSETTCPAVSATFFGTFTAVRSIEIIAPESMLPGDSAQLNAVASPLNAFDQTVTWSVTVGTGSATVSSNGLFTALSEGTVTVHAAARDGGGAVGSREITIAAPAPDAVGLSVGTATAYPGLPANVSVSIEEGSDISMLQFALLYDSTKLALDSCAAGAVMAGKEPTINDTMEGVVYFVWDDVVGLSAGGSILDLTFSVKDGVEEQEVILLIPRAGESEEYEFICMTQQQAAVDCEVLNGKIVIFDVLLGDVNDDYAVNVIDANMIRRSAARLLTLTDRQKLAGDVNGDGAVNVIDANLVRRYAARLITAFPAG